MFINRILLYFKTSKFYNGLIFFVVGVLATSTVAIFVISGERSTIAAETLVNGQVITENDLTKDGADIIIPNGATVTIDGVHNFNSVAVESGGVLTTSDYNRYGIYKEEATANDYRNAGSIFNLSNQQYSFMVRGVINTGTVHNRKFAPASGTKTASYPSEVYPDDAASISFFQPVSSADYDESNYDPAGEIGSAFAYYGSSSRTIFTDSVSDDTNRYIPFQYMYFNRSGNSNFGFIYCDSVDNCTDKTKNKFISMIGIDSIFDANPLAPEAKTLESFQTKNDLSGGSWPTNYNAMKTAFIDFFSNPSNEKYFYKATNYDFANDKKIVLENDLNFMSNPTIISDSSVNQYENYLLSGSVVRSTFAFYPTTSYNSPLALYRENCSSDEINGYPTISKSLFQSLPKKQNTAITTNSYFEVESGGMVDVNGKGFAGTDYCRGQDGVDEGTGPGAAVDIAGTENDAGGSHYGYGGFASAGPYNSRYDYSNKVEPSLPGSGSPINHNNDDEYLPYYYGYGGGFIKISSTTIKLHNQSYVVANGVSGKNTDDMVGSGGSIVLIDNDPSSYYDGIIAAMGAGTDNDSDSAHDGGGGGGYIYIKTALDSDFMKKKINYNVVEFMAEQPVAENLTNLYGGTLANTYSKWVTWGFAELTISAAGGAGNAGANSSSSEDGNYGNVNIIGVFDSSFSIRKWLEPLMRNGVDDTDFNPYALQIGDQIKVNLHVVRLSPGAIIKDEFLEVKETGGAYCEAIPLSQLPADGVIDNSAKTITWVYGGAKSEDDFTYYCEVKK